MPRFQYASDLHIDVNCIDAFERVLVPSAPYLIIAGNVCEIHNTVLLVSFLAYCSMRWKHVYYVPGNREYWGCEGIAEGDGDLRALGLKWSNVSILQTRHVIVDGVSVIGCTLWSNIENRNIAACRNAVPDFDSIPVSVYTYTRLHKIHAEWLRSEITRSVSLRPVVVVTHHAPVRSNTSHPKYAGSPLLDIQSSDLVDILDTLPTNSVWVHGHTHWNHTDDRLGVTVTSNQYGYTDTHLGREYRREAVFEIDVKQYHGYGT